MRRSLDYAEKRDGASLLATMPTLPVIAPALRQISAPNVHLRLIKKFHLTVHLMQIEDPTEFGEHRWVGWVAC
jgi:hypothetical protein